MEPTYRGLGRCAGAFWLAVAFDVFGLLILLIGVFANVFFYDFLIYAGAIVIFLSLIWWLFWYTGNIEVPPAELEDDVGLLKKDRGGGIGGAVRRLSGRVTSGIRNSLRRNGGPPPPRAPRTPGTGPSGAHTTGVARQPESQPVALATMSPPHTVSAAVDCDVAMPHTTTETSPI
ncbi:transmembrane protein 238 [Diretmus argenteus]